MSTRACLFKMSLCLLLGSISCIGQVLIAADAADGHSPVVPVTPSPLMPNADKPMGHDYLPPISRQLYFPVEDDVGQKSEKNDDVPTGDAAASGDQSRQHKTVDVESLSSSIKALHEAVERARSAIRGKQIQGLDPSWDKPRLTLVNTAGVQRQKLGAPRVSTRLNNNDLSVQAYDDGSFDVSARVRNGSALMVYSEMLDAIGKSWDDQQVINRNQLINLHVKDQPWQQALTVLLGQSGLAWSEEKDGDRSKIVIYPTSKHPRPDATLRDLALSAWDMASRQRNNGIAAHALYQRGHQYFELGQYSAAVQTFFDVSDTFTELADKDDQVRHWVKEAQLGIGDTMMALKQYREARAVYLNYLSLAAEGEYISSDVYLKAAKASQSYGEESGDILALEKAEDILDNMLLKFKGDKEAHNNIVRANYILGVLMIKRGQFVAARDYFNAFKQERGGNHKLDFYLAQCEYEIGNQEAGKNNFVNSDIHYANAQTLYRSIADDYAAGKADPLIQEEIDHIYETAYYRVGECYLKSKEPKFPEALASFLRAREAFPDSDFLDAQVLVKIAHCYAELSADQESIAYIMQMLKDTNVDESGLRLQIDELLADIQSGLGEYQGHTKAKALFYIAQGRYRLALQNPYNNNMINAALGAYERVLQNSPGHSLRDAARLGLARSAIMAKDDEYAESQLKELLRDQTTSLRDRAYASQLLGRHYREQGKFRKAIEAFQGNTTE